MYSRRFLPPIAWISAFEAVHRLGSVTAAAVELDLSQGAVSRQILKLEAHLGRALFLRKGRQLVPMPETAMFAEEMRAALGKIANATLALTSNPQGGDLNLAILPAFGTYWLAPRLSGFLAAHPGVTVNLSTVTQTFDFATSAFHAAIHFGRDDWPDADLLPIMEEEVVPVVSPLLAKASDLTSEQAVGALPRLQIASRQGAWRRWFATQGWSDPGQGAMQFDQFATMIEAAKQGVGLALAPRFLIGRELDAGTLVPLPEKSPTRFGTYYLASPSARADYPPLAAFRNWLASEVQLPD